MNKREFLKTSCALGLSGLFSPLYSWVPKTERIARKNWAGNLEYSAKNFHIPDTLEKLRDLVRNCDKLKVVGTRHCFNNIADSQENQISLKQINRIVELDEEVRTVTVEAGASYGQLCPILHEKGYALHNLASLPHISIAGACATATHGSGIGNGNLATAVSAVEFLDAEGKLITLSKKTDDDRFSGAVVGLGGLGVVTKLVLDIEPTYEVRQDVFQFLPLARLESNFDEIFSSGYSVSLFTDWQTENVNQVWIKRRLDDLNIIDPSSDFFGAIPASRDIHPILELSPQNCTKQMGVPGPWFERLPHFRMNFTPSSGKELQSEYFVPRRFAIDAIRALQKLGKQLSSLLMISEIRIVEADHLWMSTCYKQSCVVFHFTWHQNCKALKELLPLIEKELNPFGAKPHWGKMFVMSPRRIESLYEKLPDFKQLLREYDPDGKFRNNYINKKLGFV